MKIELALKILRNNRVEACRNIVAEKLSLLPIPVPSIGEQISFAVAGVLYRGVVTEKLFDLTEIDESDGVLRVEVIADEKA
jgi:hypothetical protein